ncbi:MAG: lipoate--protein ligase [Clostridia bacterium]|nr:lipoate--protein ligase [Clostridia bacterium]
MSLLTLDSTEPQFNLAAEEYIFSHTNDDAVLLWQNNNAVIIGRNQNTLAEINKEAIEKYGISVVRRITGGGAVFHDLGNVNYSVISSALSTDGLDFEKFVSPIKNALESLGVKAEFSGRNDLIVNGCKISGNAQHISDGRILHHGTLLFSSDLDLMSEVLRVNENKIKSKAIQSVRSRVANIKDFIPSEIDLTAKDFIRILEKYLCENYSCSKSALTENELLQINKLAESKYRTWGWNYGNSPKYAFSSSSYLSCGTVEIQLDISEGIIKNAAVFGDFFSVKPKEEFISALIGTEHSEKALRSLFKNLDVSSFFIGVKEDELIRCFF